MAEGTGKALRSQIIYSVFVRQYSAEGTFEALRKDLPRIRALGADILWLLPIHPIGAVRRKGTLGSPYAIRDYRAVDPEYGTREELARLVGEIHECGMKCILDVVYHHTSPDSVLAQTHPEWFFRKADGSFGNRIGGLERCDRPGLPPSAAVGLPDRNTCAVGGACRRLPL
jgi:1,4-alpha-glucan branching enzyme